MTKPAPKWPTVGSVVVEENPRDGEAPTRRNAITKDRLVTTPLDGIETVYDITQYTARTHGTKNALGWRDIVDIHEEEKEVKKQADGKEVVEKKKWKFFELSSYKYLTYVQVKEAVDEIGGGLAQLGVNKGDVFNIYALTSANWQLISHSCASIGTTIATAYDTLGVTGLQHSLEEPDCVGVFTNAELLPTLTRVVGKTPSVKLVVYDGQPSATVLENVKNAREGLVVLHIDEVREAGRGKPVDESRRAKTEDVACIMYTSGTTGPPKGVVITHANLVASVSAIFELLGHHLQPEDTYLAYLPLAHILEYIAELSFYFVGMTIGYGRVRTLMDASVRNSLGDLRELKPSIMVGVPAVWETIRKGILAKVAEAGTVKTYVFNAALAIKKANIPILKQIVDAVVFNAIRQQTGGRLRIALSGAAAISRDTQEFLCATLVTLIQGYGMTESCGMCAILPPELLQTGTVGLPVPSIEVKLRDVPDAGYLATNTIPQGEVLIRGPSVIKGYYKRPDLNEDETIFTKDGWLRTGDVGQWNANGTLSLIDRVKNLVKLQGGEYIALERLESIYGSCNLVANVCVHANPDAKQPIAIIIPHEVHLRQVLADKPELADRSLHDLCASKEVQDIVLKACNAAGKKNDFKQLELLEAVVLTPDEWKPKSGLVTASHKIQRKKIAEAFDKEIKAAYGLQK